jgi:general secretion pathway protein M
LAIGVASLILFILLQFIVFPLSQKKKKLKRATATQATTLVEMREMQAKYSELERQNSSLFKQMENRPPDFSLFSFIEQAAGRTKVKDNIAYMKPSSIVEEGAAPQDLVEMKLKTVGLQQLVDFLQEVESPENVVALRRISIQKNKDEEAALDVIMQVVSISQQQEEGNL